MYPLLSTAVVDKPRAHSSPDVLDSVKAQRHLTQFDDMDLTTPRADTVVSMASMQELTPMPELHIHNDTTPEGSTPNTPNTSRRTDDTAAGDDSFSTVKAVPVTNALHKLTSLSPRIANPS
jgi:hypothetical protein